ncbi:hypothetical protein Aduo_004344 [Ancylostoma duodenale]
MGELNSSLRQLNWLIAKGGEAINEPTPSNPATKTSPRVRDEDKPPYSYTQLIRMAIENSPGQRCSLNGIYTYIADNFKYFRENRNPSWKNSVRHNLSLNKQFRRLDRKEGEKGSLWICVNAPDKRLRSLDGSPPRINPAIERLYMEGRLADIAVVPSNKPVASKSANNPQESLENIIQQESMSISEDVQLEAEEDLSELSLFASQDLSASFKAVYDQIFQNDDGGDRSKTEEQIDWLKIGMETAGIDYTSEEDIRSMDTGRFSDYMSNMFPECMSFRSRQGAKGVYGVDRYQSIAQLYNPDSLEEESEDEFDWSTIT